MNDKIPLEGNVQQPEQTGRVTQSRGKRRTGEHSRVSDPQDAQGRVGVEIVGGGPVGGVKVESKRDGGSIETVPELGGTDKNERDADGRRSFT